jgi:hypothetical protein
VQILKNPAERDSTSRISPHSVASQYSLAPNVFACVHRGTTVLLDLKRDKYISVDPETGARLQGLVAGWPGTLETGSATALGEGDEVKRILHDLCSRGLLSPDAHYLETRVSAPAPRTELTGNALGIDSSITGSDVARFIKAYLRAKARVRLLSLENLTLRKKQLDQSCRCKSHNLSEDQILQLCWKHAWLRPWFYAATDVCIFECLVLLEFLAQFDCTLRWVFGVRTEPFSAHCWLQHGQAVVNDTVENVCRFTPIMMV